MDRETFKYTHNLRLCYANQLCLQVNHEEFESAEEEEGIHSDYGSDYETAQTEV